MGGIGSIAAKIGCTGESLRGWVRQAERDQGHRPGPTSDDRARRDTALQADIKSLSSDNRVIRLIALGRWYSSTRRGRKRG